MKNLKLKHYEVFSDDNIMQLLACGSKKTKKFEKSPKK